VWKEIGDVVKGEWFPVVVDTEVVDLESVVVPDRFISSCSRVRGPRQFDLTPEFLWIVGLYIAEGSSSPTSNSIKFTLHASETEFVKRIREFSSASGYGYGTRVVDGITILRRGNGVQVSVNSKTLGDWFPEWLGRGANNKRIPAELLRLPAEKLYHLVRGIMDGDGRKKTGDILQTSEMLALQLVEAGIRLGFQPTTTKVWDDGNELHHHAYTVHEVCSTRHNDRQKKHTWKILDADCRNFTSLSRREYWGLVYDIEVEEDHSFVVQNVPVHNCVHDYYGHCKDGFGMRADGEENAWRSHSAMFSPLARRAMTSETRGQNSWVNFGPHAEKNRTASAADTVYADQKVGLLPGWVVEEGTEAHDRKLAEAAADYAESGTKAKAFKDWFGDWDGQPDQASKVVNQDGEPQQTMPISGEGDFHEIPEAKPVIVYHGTARGGFDKFSKQYVSDDNLYGPGFYFTEDPGLAEEYESKGTQTSEVVGDEKEAAKKLRERIKAAYDRAVKDGKAERSLTLDDGRVMKLDNSPEYRKMDDLANYYGDDLLLKTVRRDAESGGGAWWNKQGVRWDDVIRTSAEVKACYLNIRRPFDIGGFSLVDDLTKNFGPDAAAAAVQVHAIERMSQRGEDYAQWQEDSLVKLREEMAAVKFVPHQKVWEVLNRRYGGNRALQSAGFDGITHVGGHIMGTKEHRVWIAFEPNQIKAVENRGTFDPASDVIYESLQAADLMERGFTGEVVAKDGRKMYFRDGKPSKRNPDEAKGAKGRRSVKVDGREVRVVAHDSKTGRVRVEDDDGRRQVVDAERLDVAAQSEASAPRIKAAQKEYAEKGVHAKAFKAWFGDWGNDPKSASKIVDAEGRPQRSREYSKVVDDDGDPILVYHGTTHDFDKFDEARTNVENHLGKGFYFSESTSDVERNYAGVGPDLRSRIGQRMEEMEGEAEDVIYRAANWHGSEEAMRKELDEYLGDITWVTPKFKRQVIADYVDGELMSVRDYRDEIEKLATAELSGDSERVLEVYLNIRRPVVLDFEKGKGTRLEIMGDWDPDDEDALPQEGALVEALREVADDYRELDALVYEGGVGSRQPPRGTILDVIINKLQEDYGEDCTAQEFKRVVEDLDDPLQREDPETGRTTIIASQLVADVFKKMGFDGVVYADASKFFPNMGIPPGTRHFIAWKPNQIKAASNRGTFDASSDVIYESHQKGTGFTGEIVDSIGRHVHFVDGKRVKWNRGESSKDSAGHATLGGKPVKVISRDTKSGRLKVRLLDNGMVVVKQEDVDLAGEPASSPESKPGGAIRGQIDAVAAALAEFIPEADARAAAEEVGLHLSESNIRGALAKRGKTYDESKQVAQAVAKKAAAYLAENGIPAPTDLGLAEPGETDEQREARLKEEGMRWQRERDAEREASKSFADKNFKNPPAPETIGQQKWQAVRFRQKLEQVRKDMVKINTLNRMRIKVSGDALDWSDFQKRQQEPSYHADLEAYEKEYQRPYVKRLLNRYKYSGQKRGDDQSVTGAEYVAKRELGYAEDNWREGFFDSTEDGRRAAVEHAEAVKSAIGDGQRKYEMPEEVLKVYQYENWLPQKYRDALTTRSWIAEHAQYMKNRHAYALGHLRLAMAAAQPKIDALMERAKKSHAKELAAVDKATEEAAEAQQTFQMLTNSLGDLRKQYVREYTFVLIPPEKMAIQNALERDWEKAKADFKMKAASSMKMADEVGKRWLQDLLPEKGDDAISIPAPDFLDASGKQAAADAEKFLRRAVSATWGKMPIGVQPLEPGRYRAYHSGNNITVSANESTWVFVHEFGHHIEHQDGDVLGFLSKAFAMQALIDSKEEPQSLGSGYEPNEIGAKDDLSSPYTGKFYTQAASEVLSMGVQHLYEDALSFFKVAPKHFAYTLAALHGWLTPPRGEVTK